MVTISYSRFSLYLRLCILSKRGFPSGSDGKESACNVGNLGSILGWEDPLEEGMATYSSVLAWRISWTEDPGGLQSIGSQRVGHDRNDLEHRTRPINRQI